MARLFFSVKCDTTDFIDKNFGADQTSLFIVGGDGTYLRALSDCPKGTVPPVYAFNKGTVGALLPLAAENIGLVADKIANCTLRFIERHRLLVSSHNRCVANDLIIYSKRHRLGTFRVHVDGSCLELRGDSITVSTMSGSSGHNFSIGGPVLLSEGIVINCAGPNRCNFRPIVLPTGSKIRIETRECIGVFDNYFSAEDDVFEIESGDVYRVAVDDGYDPVRNLSLLFLLHGERAL